MRAALLIAANDLRQRLRDRSFFIFGVIVPFVLALLFSLLLAPLTGSAPLTAKVVLVDSDGSAVSAGLRTALTAAADAGVVTWQTAADEPAARALLDGGKVDAAIIVPAGFGAAVLRALPTGPSPGGGPQDDAARQLTVLGDRDKPLSAQLTRSVASAYVSRLRSASWSVDALAAMGRPAVAALVFARVASLPDAVGLVASPTSSRQLGPKTYYAAGMAVFFVFFIVQLGVMSLLDEEREGTLARLLLAPHPRSTVLAAKVLSSVGIGLLSMVVLAVASTLVMGANWGAPLGVLLLVLAVVSAAAGILLLVAGAARTSEAAGNLQAIIAITLGALGGTFFPLGDRGGIMAVLPKLTPHYWFMRGVGDLRGAGIGAIGTDLLALVAFALVTGTIGWLLVRRRLNP